MTTMTNETPGEALLRRLGIPYANEEPLSRHTGFRTGGPADALAKPQTKDELCGLVAALRREEIPFFLLGKGTNVLAPDEGYRGVVVLTEQALTDLDFDMGSGTVTAGAGVSLAALCTEVMERGLTGLEFAYGIPGSVGGALFMNAGAYDGEMKDVAHEVRVLCENGAEETRSAAQMDFSYRHSAAQQDGSVILAGTFALMGGDAGAIRARMNELMASRKEKQPLELPSCGSAFKRPQGSYASKLIDECGLRGFTVGGAQVSEKHCGFVVNRGGATSADILTLLDRVRQTVFTKTGFDLEPEIRILR